MLNPSSVSSLSQAAARVAMDDQASAVAARRHIAEQRAYLTRAIGDLGLAVVPSQASFILVDFGSPEASASAFRFLREQGIVVRPMGGYGLPACLRISIGTVAQMQAMAAILADWREAGG